jgi:hypothetical protein
MLVSLAVVMLVVGQPPQPPQPVRPPVQGLAEAYVDGTYKFSIQPPQGWQLVPRREHLRDEIVLLRMIEPLPDHSVHQIILSQYESENQQASQSLKRAAHNLELKYSGVEIINQQEQHIAERPAAYLSASFRIDNAKHLHLEVIVQLGKSQCMSIMYEGPWEQHAQTEPLFQRVLSSLRLLHDQMSDKELDAAFEAGKKWLASLTEKRIRSRIIPDQVLRIEYEGKLVGFTRIQQFDQVVDRHSGVRIRERGWIFEPEGRVQRLQNSMFVSYDLAIERWRGSYTALPPPKQGANDVLEVRLEEGVRTGNILLSNQTFDMLEPSAANPAMTLPDMYLSRALMRLMPSLIDDLSSHQTLGFLEFDHNKAGLIIRIVETKGKAQLPNGAVREKVYRIDEREGLAADPSEIFVDSAGRIVLAKMGRMTMRAGRAEDLEKEFASRIAAADARMNELENAYHQQEQRFSRPAGR